MNDREHWLRTFHFLLRAILHWLTALERSCGIQTTTLPTHATCHLPSSGASPPLVRLSFTISAAAISHPTHRQTSWNSCGC